jgi:hypothetical protein
MMIKRGRIRRTGIVLTPIVMLSIGYGMYTKARFPKFPFFCYQTDKRSAMGFSPIESGDNGSLRSLSEWLDSLVCSAIRNWHLEQEHRRFGFPFPKFDYLKDASMFEYRGATLVNSEHLGEVELEPVVSRFKKMQDDDVWNFYVRLIGIWSSIIGASLLGLGALWICLAALDWVLAA